MAQNGSGHTERLEEMLEFAITYDRTSENPERDFIRSVMSRLRGFTCATVKGRPVEAQIEICAACTDGCDFQDSSIAEGILADARETVTEVKIRMLRKEGSEGSNRLAPAAA